MIKLFIKIIYNVYINVRMTILWLFALLGALYLIRFYDIEYWISHIILIFLLIEGILLIFNQYYRVLFNKDYKWFGGYYGK